MKEKTTEQEHISGILKKNVLFDRTKNNMKGKHGNLIRWQR